MGIISSCNPISTMVGLHHLDFYKMLGEKAGWELHKGGACYFEQILKAASTLQKNSYTTSYLPSHKLSK